MAFPTPTLVASGVTFSGLAGKGLAGHLEALLARQVATADPTAAPTLAANADAASTLPSASYYVKFTETNAFGETKPSPISAAQAIVSGTNHLTVTFPALKAGNTARNVYVGTAADGSNLKLAASGVTASSVNIAAPLPSNSYAVAPPTVNSTAPNYAGADGVARSGALALIRGFERGDGQDAYRRAAQVVENFLRGDPIDLRDAIGKLRASHAALLMAATAIAEVATLIDANAGSLTTTNTGIGGVRRVRTWP